MTGVHSRLLAVVEDITKLALNQQRPGFGPTDYPDSGPADIPKAYAMVVKAAALDNGRTPELQALGSASFSWLMAHCDQNGDSIKGWGLPFAWDAFGDGTPNPADTEYAITTAIVIDALLDRANVLDGEERASVLQLCVSAITPYMDRAVETPGALPPYSLTSQDRSWDVYNTAAYLAAMAQRLSNMEVDSGTAESMRQFADQVMQTLVDRRLIADDGAWYWPYLSPGSSVNDLPHAAYIAYGVERYSREGGHLTEAFPADRIWAHFRAFSASDYIHAYPASTRIATPARSYDIGFALSALAHFGNPLPDVLEQLVAAMSTYRLEDGHYAKYPVTGHGATDIRTVVTEYETYFLYGATAALASPDIFNFIDGADVAIIGTTAADVLTGNRGRNVLIGFGGDDEIVGNAGDDLIDGGDGSDAISGGSGNDTLIAGSGLWVDVLDGGSGDDIFEVYNPASPILEGPGAGRDTVRSYAWQTVLWNHTDDLELVDPVNNVSGTGNALDNVIKGNAVNNYLRGLDGADTLIGNGGSDTLEGGDGSDTLNGGAGDDLLIAGSGSWLDVLVGAAGDDIYEIYNAAASIYENPGDGRDTVRSNAWATILPDNVEDLELIDPRNDVDGIGNALDNVVKGNRGNNRLAGLNGDDILIGRDGDDTLDGADGSDTLNGGDGNDRLIAGSGAWTDVLVGAAGDDTYEIYSSESRIYENPGEGKDLVQSYAWTVVLWANVENLHLVDPRNNVAGTGNGLDNIMMGNAYANLLRGVAGNDTLIGAGGTDTLDGGAGDDLFVLRAGDGGTLLEQADVVVDFRDGSDAIGLIDSLCYSDLLVSQGTGAYANDTILQHTSGEYLAVLRNVSAASLDLLDFRSYE